MIDTAQLARALRATGLKEMADAVAGCRNASEEDVAFAIKAGVERIPMLQACAAGGIDTPERLLHVMKHGDDKTAAQKAEETIEALTGVPLDEWKRRGAAAGAARGAQGHSTSPDPAAPAAEKKSRWDSLTPEQKAFAQRIGNDTPEKQEAFAATYFGDLPTPVAAASSSTAVPPAPPAAAHTPPADPADAWSRLSPAQQKMAARMGAKTPEQQKAFAEEYFANLR